MDVQEKSARAFRSRWDSLYRPANEEKSPVMQQCTAKTGNGARCERIVSASETLCYSHSPETAAARSENASVAARAKTNAVPELREIKRHLKRLFADLDRGEVDPKRAATLVTVVNAQMRAVSLEAELTHNAELGRKLERIEDMERQVKRRWAN